MKKEEVLTLLERFPELVDSDDLIQDLYTEASGESGEPEPAARTSTAMLAEPTKAADAPPKLPR